VAAVLQKDVIDLPKTDDGVALIVIETPRGSGNKLTYDPDLGAFKLDRVLPAGMTFPFDFGFIPQTIAEDGDPLDVIVLLDSPAYHGCVVPSRLVANLEAEQRDAGSEKWERNDRLIAVADASRAHASVRTVRDIDPFILESIGAFFADYHRMDGGEFRVTGNGGARAAERAVREANETYRDRRNGSAAGSNGR
jgi:inorganic pyrophosphatase